MNTKKWARRIATVLSGILLFGVLVTLQAYRFANPAMTETQLVIQLWPLVIPIVLSLGGFWWGMRD